jgi:predicted ATPase
MITAFTLQNFKSHLESTLPLAPLTVLIGANASGKSNALEGLRLLSWIAQGQKLSALGYQAQGSERIVRGRLSDLSNFSLVDGMSITCDTDHPEWPRYQIKLSVREDDELHIDQECIRPFGNGVPLFEVKQRASGVGSDMLVAYNNFSKGHNKPQVSCSDQISLLIQMESAARIGESHSKAQEVIPQVSRWYQEVLTRVVFLDPVPARMRGYSFSSEKRLLGDGSNISAILYKQCQDPKGKELVLGFVRSLPEQNISDISFIEARPSEVMIKITETFGDQRREYDASLLSDGTLRVLAIAAVMLSAPEGSLVVIEEIDNGVHPSRARDLLAQLSSLAKDRSLRVLLSSHNPALLDGLPDDAVPAVVLCYRNPTTGASNLVRLSDLPDYPELVAQGPVGFLMTSGVLDRFVKSHPGSEKKKAKALAWLDQIRMVAKQ